MQSVSGPARPAEGPAERLRVALDLYELCEGLYRQRLRRERPGASPEEIDEAIGRWLRHRPGAEYGDGPGRVSTRRL